MRILATITHRKLVIVSILFFILCPLFLMGSCSAGDDIVQVHILGVNDFHGQLTRVSKHDDQPVGTAPYLAAHLKQRKAMHPEHTLLVHAGDMVGASSVVSSLLQDEPTVDVMNAIGFDLGIPGNHEFEEGPDEMMRLIKGGVHPKTGPLPFKGTTFPYIAANVVYKDTNKQLLPPSIIKEVDGIKIAFIGVVTKDTPITSTPGSVDSLIFIDEVDAIQQEIVNVKKAGAHTIVIVAHEGGLLDEQSHMSGRIVDIANALPEEVSVIIAGHTHAFNNEEVNGKLIVQSKCYGVAFEDVTLDINRKTGKVVTKKAEFVPTTHDGITPDSEVEKIVKEAEGKVAPFISEVVGHCENGIKTKRNEVGESPLGEFLADAQRAWMKTDFALINPEGVRADIPAGEVTVGTLHDIQPHGNSLNKIAYTGKQIRAILNQQFKNHYRAQVLQPSGFTFSYDLTRPTDDRIVEVKKEDGTPIEDNTTYTMTMNNFLASGGDGFTHCTEGKKLAEKGLDIDALIAYVKTMPDSFDFRSNSRIQRLG